ncbi:MAG: hypothetical protein E7646_09150 [Ruminococcaceae bacterium]|nr:hypothetical protein [Oscillospiraceae bacterium]
MKEKTLNVWMQLMGFEKNDPDRGAKRFIDRAGFVPDNICALLFNADFVHLHRGMETEYTLFPDNCAYRGVLRNKERRRQAWTNYELRELISELKKYGVGFYAGLMGSHLKDRFHHEWLSDHPELTCMKTDSEGELACLKRFKDGSYYEDFFIERLCETLCDYGFEGVHLADAFCPMNMVYRGDWSTDMTEQFMMHTGIKLPQKVLDSIGDDGFDGRRVRHEYIWFNLREEWIEFYQWRWEQFFRKLSSALHAVGKKVWVLGMYCTDPFESKYIYAFDCKGVLDAGVDCITANILPTSVTLETQEYPYFFHKMHMDLPLLRAQVGDDKNIISMVGVQDASEEWSVLDHAPVNLERDIYTMSSWFAPARKSSTRAADGLFFCLGDGISPEGWKLLKNRSDIGFSDKFVKSHSPMILWSEHQNKLILGEYIKNRRTSTHKQSFEIEKAGSLFGGALTADKLEGFDGVLFVPNYDLCSDAEKALLNNASFKWVGTCPKEYCLDGVGFALCFDDPLGDLPLKAFACNFELDGEEKQCIDELLKKDDPAPSRRLAPEGRISPLTGEMPFAKISCGFVEAVGKLLSAASYRNFPVKCTRPFRAMLTEEGKDRLYIYNPFDRGYTKAAVSYSENFKSAEIVSAYPVLPPRFLQEGEIGTYYDFDNPPEKRNRFEVKLCPDGVTIIDILR